MMLIVVD